MLAESRAMCVVPGQGARHVKSSTFRGDAKTLAASLDRLSALRSDELAEQWRSLFRSEPPNRLRRPVMIHALAYRLQERALGGLKTAIRHQLDRIASDAGAPADGGRAKAVNQTRRGPYPGVARHCSPSAQVGQNGEIGADAEVTRTRMAIVRFRTRLKTFVPFLNLPIRIARPCIPLRKRTNPKGGLSRVLSGSGYALGLITV